MRRLVKKDYKMNLVTSKFPNGSENENIEGINIVRKGGKFTVYEKARAYYKKHKDEFDIIVDETNVKPFLTPKFVKGKPILLLIHQLSREGIFYELSFPLDYLVYYFLEKRWLSNYDGMKIVTVSESTRVDICEFLGFKNVCLVPEGLSIKPLTKLGPKEMTPTIVYLGRLKNYKLPHHALIAFSLIKKEVPNAKMWVIGYGDMRKKLEDLHVPDVTFFGRVSHDLKFELLGKAHLALVPSVKEGWGLVVTECNAMGTPCVAYNVSGLRDSVIDGKTGVLVKENSPPALAQAAVRLLNDKDWLSELSHNALTYSRKFDWDISADTFDKILRSAITN